MHKTIPAAQRVLGDNDRLTLKARWFYAQTLFLDSAATLDDLREAVTTVDDLTRTARRVFGGTHPLTVDIGRDVRDARAALRAREDTQS